MPDDTQPVTAPLAGLTALLTAETAVLTATAGHGTAIAVPEAARALFAATVLRAGARRPVVLVVPTAIESERLAHDLAQYLPADAVELFPAWETLPFERVSPALETMGRRLRVMWRLRRGEDSLPAVVVAPVRALVQRLGPHVEDIEPIVVRPGQRLDRDELLEQLVAAGYRREYQVEARGEVSVRGSIVDVYPTTSDHPVRIDLWGDEVDRLSHFSVADQRSTDEIADAWIFPARELLPTDDVRKRAEALVASEPWGREQWDRLAEGQTFDGMESWLPWLCDDEHLLPDLLPNQSLVALVEPRRLRDRAQELLDEERALADTLATTWGAVTNREWPRLSLPFDRLLEHTRAGVVPVLATPDRPETQQLAASAFDPVVGDTEALARRLNGLRADGFRVFIAAEGGGSAERIGQLLAEEGVSADPISRVDDNSPALQRPGVHIVVAPLDRGAVFAAAKLALVAEADLTGRRRVHRKPRAARRGVDHYEGLAPGDHVVHRVHGIGRYTGMETREMFGVTRDRLVVEFRGADRVYVDSEDIGLLRKYTGGEVPKLSKMGGADWDKTRARVRKAVADIAAELVILYRKRISTPGHAFAVDTPFQRQIEESFPYEETPDQQKAIDETKADMEQPVPMDRLVCGDVGYGKTEVALRAAAKAVFDGRQVAVLVPTTLLASQHGQTFRERFANYPVRVEALSRFLTTKEQNEVVKGVADGSVDIIIGTHRLLSNDINFKDLGLLVVDEEQRFGVQHKERIKQFRTNVDVLTLTATPIPRTLELSLTGIRDLSLVNTPPEDRQPILTYVGEYDSRAVQEAIRRELLREGQVLFVHNRVKDIEHVAGDVRELVPEARVAVAHGQMDEGRLETVVTDFWEQEHDVLVCTTIVESGLDMPTVNTLVVDRADLLGLAQLYQLRGRVGRRGQRAYAYLLHPADRALTEEAYERLKTIGEFTDLGSGFKIAMRDLEIRGAGNLLGGEQSGHIAAVGFDLYVEMVTQAVDELTGQHREPPAEVQIDVPVTAHLSGDYIARDDVRMEAYRRLASVTSEADVEDIRAEWIDRYGPPPPAAAALLEVARLRAECTRLGITAVSVQRGIARFEGLELRKSQEIKLKRLVPKAAARDGNVTVPVGGSREFGSGPADPVELVTGLVTLLGELVPAESVPGLSASVVGGSTTTTLAHAMTPRHRFVRFVAVLAGVLVLGATAAACSDNLSDAASADDTHIPRDEFNAELEHLVANDAFVELLSQGGQYTFSDDKKEIGTPLASTWLSLRLRQVAIDDEFEARDLEVTDELRTQARTAVDESYGGKAIVDDFDEDFRATLVERQARTLALAQALEDEEPSADDARAFYDANRDALFPCQTSRTVSHIVVATEAEAQAVLDELADGAEFAELAQERSIDAASREQGGVVTNSSVPLGCYPAGVSTELDTAVQSAPFDEPVGPVQTGSGYEVLLVEQFEPPSFEDVGEELQQQLAADPQARLLVLQDRRMRELDVTVDPRYGEWVIDEQGARVEPPDEPNVRESRNPKVTPPTANPLGGVPSQ